MTRAMAGLYLIIAAAFVAVSAYLSALTTGDVTGFVGIF